MLKQLNELLKNDPFVPFQIVMTNGHRYDVNDPSLVVVMESQVFVAEPRGDGFKFLRFNQIASLESIERAA